MLLLRFHKHIILNGTAIADLLNCLALYFAVALRVFNHLLQVFERLDSFRLDQLTARGNQLGFYLFAEDLVATLNYHHHPVEVLSVQFSVRNAQFAFNVLKSQRIYLVAQPFDDELFGFLGCHARV